MRQQQTMVRPSMCVAMGSTVYELSSSLSHSHSHHHHHQHHLLVSSFAWDPPSRSFSPPSRRPSPLLSGDVELLIFRVVHNYALGRSQPHVVMRRGSLLSICVLDTDTNDFITLVEIELPVEEQLNKSISKWTFEGCWLVDGPVLLAQIGKKFIMVRSLFGANANTFEDDDQLWDAQLLNFDKIDKSNSMRVIYYGELELFSEPALLLCIHFSDETEFDLMPCNNRLRVGWNFIKLSIACLDGVNVEIHCSSKSSWREVEIGNYLDVCNQLFPPEMCPDIISYMDVIPKDPVETVSYVASLAHSVDNCHGLLSHDIVVGFWNRKVVKYRIGTVVAKTDLKDALTSLQFAIVAGSQGILLCTLNGGLGGIVILCAETLITLKAWTGIEQAVIGDFQLIGHDQVLLLALSSQGGKSSTSDVSYLRPMHLTDMKNNFFSNLKQPSQLDASDGATETHKIKNLDAIALCLQSRLEDGFSQMKFLEEQRTRKAELVQSSCKLLQNMIIKHESPESVLGLVSIADFMSKVVRASVVKQGICGRTWFLYVKIENISSGGVILHDLSLSFTTVRGPISGISSVLKSLCMKDKGKHLIAAISLMDFPTATPSSVLHIFVGLTVCKINDLGLMHSVHMKEKGKNHGEKNPMHKIWIEQIKLYDILATRSLDPRSVPLEFREVAVQQTLMIQKRPNDQCTDIINAIKAALRMETRSRNPTDSAHELVATQGALWSDSTIIQVGQALMVTLRAEDIKHLSAVKTCLVTQLKSKHYHITGAYPQLVEALVAFIKVFQEELEHTRLLLKEPSDLPMLMGGDLLNEATTSNEVMMQEEHELQMSTDCFMGSLLGSITNQLWPCSG